jgi:hypothetical protein
VVVALVVSGCNANQAVNSSSRAAPAVVAGPDFPGYNAYDPTKYAQTSGFYAGGGDHPGGEPRWSLRLMTLGATSRIIGILLPLDGRET